MTILNASLSFPPINTADEDGLLAIGGDLNTERIKLAYQQGIFPWYNENEPICWYCPNPRFVLFVDKLRISKSLQKTINEGHFTFKENSNFEEVIRRCKETKRKGQYGTWITSEMERAYIQLHHQGIAHSAETYDNGQLVGGLYGVLLDKVFCGESMFSLETNASKFAFVTYVEQLKLRGVKLIDCQIHSSYLESFGAEFISIEEYLSYVS